MPAQSVVATRTPSVAAATSAGTTTERETSTPILNQTTTRADNPRMNPPHETLGVEEVRAAPTVRGMGERWKLRLAEAPKEW